MATTTKFIAATKRTFIEREVTQKISLAIMQTIITFCLNYEADHGPQQFYGGYGIEDIAWVFFFFLCTNQSYKKLEQRTGIPHSIISKYLANLEALLEDSRLELRILCSHAAYH